MPVTSQKNAPLTGIAATPGFGANQLADQLRDETEEERRRRLLGLSPLAGARGPSGAPPLSPATLSLFGMSGYGRAR
jgi:hypothetical protein